MARSRVSSRLTDESETFARRSRGEATFVSSHGAIVADDHRLPFDAPLRFLAPAEQADRREAVLLREGLTQASAAQFAMADLAYNRSAPFEEQTGLFHAFAKLKSEEDVIAFANQFGPLGADLLTAIVDVVPGEPGKQGLNLYWAEPIDLWQSEANAMARVIGLWDLIRAGDGSVFNTRLTRKTARLRIRTGSSGLKHLEKS